MKHPIDPKVDCVFKALLGSEENRNLLTHFLNAMLAKELKAPVVEVEIQNPYNDKEFLSDKFSIVDVKARDNEDRLYQIEIQMAQYAHLTARMLYSWADIYSQQLQSGDDYHLLKPTYSIWLLNDTLMATDDEYAHSYKLRDQKGQVLLEHGGIWLFEIEKFHAQTIASEAQRWLRFFKEGEELDDQNLPDWMDTPEMEQAMSTLQKFSDKERDYHAYQARQNYVREQRSIQKELEEALEREATAMEREAQALSEKDQALVAKEQALAEIERLKALLNQKGTMH